jgi:hypothetical protein
MWNSGVLGFSQEHRLLIEEGFDLLRQMTKSVALPGDYWRIAEQIIHSYCLSKAGEPLATESFIIHYWWFKQARYLLANHFGYFHGADELEFNRIMHQWDICPDDVSVESYESLPGLLFDVMKRFSLLSDHLFLHLPSDSYIGKVLRGIS